MHRLGLLLSRASIRTLLCALWLCLAPLALFAPVTLGTQTLLPADNLFLFEPYRSDATTVSPGIPQNELLSDLILQNYQWKAFINRSIAARELPLWNPYLFAGAPFLAAGQHSALYPFSALYYVLPLERAFGWFTVTQLALAGLNMYLLARTLGTRRASATLAGTAFQLSGFIIAGVVHPMIVAAAAWLPAILALTEKTLRQDNALGGRPASLPWAVLGALAIGCSILAGHAEITVYTAVITATFALWRIVQLSRQIGARETLQRVLWLVLMGVAGALLAAIQIGPLFELVTRNFRGAGRSTLDQVRGYAYPSRYVLLWLLPNIFGNPSQHSYMDLFTLARTSLPALQGSWWGYAGKQYVESAVYAGLLPLLLSLVALTRLRDHITRARMIFFVVFAIACVLFMFGTPAYALLYYGLPGVNQLHSPYRWNIPFTLCLCVLAAFGFDRVLTLQPDARAPRRIAIALSGLGVATALAVVGARFAWPVLATRVTSAYTNSTLAPERFPSPEAFFSVLAGNIVVLGLTLTALGVALLWLFHNAKHSRDTCAPIAALVALVALDLSIAWAGFNPSVDPALLRHTPPAIAFLKQQADANPNTPFRVTSYEPNGGKTANANMLWMHGIQDIRGYDSIIPKQYADYMRAIEPQDDLLYNRIAPLYKRESLESPLLDLLGVRYVLTEQSIDTPGFTLAFEQPGMRIYENTRTLPRAYVVDGGAFMAGTPFSNTIQSVDPRRAVIVDVCPPNLACTLTPADAAKRPIGGSPAVITVYKNGEVWVDAQTASDSQWLILNDSHFPGWRAWIRPVGGTDASEVEVPVYKVNGNFRAVQLDTRALGATSPTALTVRFRYSPDSVRFGGFASLITLLGLLFGGGVYAWRSLARDASQLSGAQRVARNSAVLTGMNILGRLIAFAAAIVVARILTAEGVGAWYKAVVLMGPFDILLNFGLNTWLTRQAAQDKANAGAYFRYTTALRLSLALIIVPLLLVAGLGLGAVGYFQREVVIAFSILGFSQIISSINSGLSALFFAQERGEIPAATSFLAALLTAVLSALLLLAGLGIPALAVTSILVNFVTLGVLFGQSRRVLKIDVLKPAQLTMTSSRRTLLRDALPLMLNHMIPAIEYQLDVPVIGAFKPSARVFGAQPVTADAVSGWYATGYRYLNAFNIVPSYFTQAFFPAMSRLAAQGNNALGRAFGFALKLLVMLSLPLAVAMTFMSTWMAGIFGPDFLPHAAVAVAIAGWSMVPGWLNSLTNYALIAAHKQELLIRAFVITLVFNVIANLIFIPLYSYIGAAVVTIASEIVKGAVFYYFVRKHIGPVNWGQVLAKPALAAGVMALVSMAGWTFDQPLIGVVLGAAAYLGMLVLLRTLSPDERALLGTLRGRA
jgi:O-antigen/teichoic acid export membrane protein